MAEPIDEHLGAAAAAPPRGYVLVVGPDGAGKSTLVRGVLAAIRAQGVPVVHAHSRPNLLFPKAAGGEVTQPHAQPPRGTLAGAAKLAAVFLDHLIGGHLRWGAARRSGVVLVERGWLDQAADPRRYRLRPSLARWIAPLAGLLPRADVVLVLGGDPAQLHGRKPEIGGPEVARQSEFWRTTAYRAGRRVIHLDTVRQSETDCVTTALAQLPTRADGPGSPLTSSGGQWRRVRLAPARLELCAWGPSPRAALAVYRPFSRRARWVHLLRAAALPYGPQVPPPIPELSGLLHRAGLEPDGLVAMRSSTPGRLVIGASRNGRLEAVIKIGVTGDQALANEISMLTRDLHPGLPFDQPQVLWTGEWSGRLVLATAALHRVRRSVRIDDVVPVVVALGSAGPDRDAITHGDVAPWNMVSTREGLTLLDWESARMADEPLHDLAHFVVQQGALLGRISPRRAVALLCGPGSAGHRVLLARGSDPALAPALVCRYLAAVDPASAQLTAYRAAVMAVLSARFGTAPANGHHVLPGQPGRPADLMTTPGGARR